MTTSDGKFTPDVFTRGGEVYLPPTEDSHEALAAVSFVEPVVGELRDARRMALRRALALATAGISPSDSIARLLVTYAWEPDSVRARATSPLKGFAAKGVVFPSSVRTEVLIIASKGVRWSAEVEVRSEDTAQVESALFEATRATLVLGAAETVIHRFLATGWGDSSDSRLLLRDTAVVAAQLGLVVVRLFGGFDDREVSADIIGPPPRILGLLKPAQ